VVRASIPAGAVMLASGPAEEALWTLTCRIPSRRTAPAADS